MKKMLALILALILLPVLCACGAAEEAEEILPDPVIGSWQLSGLELEGEDASAYASLFEIRLEFWADGTGTVTSGEDSFSVTWKDNAFFDGTDTIRYTVEGDSLRFDAEGLTFVFTRS